MASLALPYRTAVWYWVENTYGGGESAVTLPISCKILDARISVADKHKGLHGVNSPMTCHLLEQAEDLSFHLEYIPQARDTMIDDVIDRVSSSCTLQSLAFMVTNNQGMATANLSYFYLTGCKPRTVRISASHNTEYVVAIDYSVKAVVTTSLIGTAPSVLTGSYMAFNTSSTGAITKDGGAIAYITDSINLNFNHNISDRWDHDSVTKDYAIEGPYDIDGSVDISLDEGGANFFAEVLSQPTFTIIVNMGTTTGSPIITLQGCSWKSGDVDSNTGGENLMTSAPFIAKPTDCSTMVSAT